MLVAVSIADLTSSPQTFRLVLVAVSAVLLIAGFVAVYSSRPAASSKRLWRLNAAMMWVVAAGVAVFAITSEQPRPVPSVRSAPRATPRVTPDPAQLAQAERLTLAVKGMVCQNCVQTVTEALLSVPGVLAADVDLGSASAVVSLAHDRVPADSALTNPIVRAGYKSWLIRDNGELVPPTEPDKDEDTL
jgi:copper chaperone CopZ